MLPPSPRRIQMRHGTTLQWAADNAVLAPAEPGYDTDTREFKIGDGIRPWSMLPLANPPIFRGQFVPGTYLAGQYVEGVDGYAYVARRFIQQASAAPTNGSLWRRTNWGGTGGSTSPLLGATITIWQPKTYDADLVVVIHKFTLYQLTVDALPFVSVDIELELEYGQWEPICCDNPGLPIDSDLYLLDEDGRRILDENGQPITVD